MKILFVSTEFEEQGRGITGIIKSMIRAAKADGHEVGVLVGYPSAQFKKSELLDAKVEHINLQHYLRTGKKNLFPDGLKGKKTQLKVLLRRTYLRSREFKVRHDLITDSKNIASHLDYVIKIPYCYQFFNHGMERVSIPVLKRAIKKSGVDLVITGAPMKLTSSDVSPAKLAQFVHDAMPVEMLETPADQDTPFRFAEQFYAASAESDLLFVNSVDTRNKVLEINNDAKTMVVYGTASSVPSETQETSILRQYGLEKDKFLLYISVVEKRKNVDGLMEAYALIHDKLKMPLVIVGGKGYGFKDIYTHYKSLPPEVSKDIFFAGFVSEDDKYTLLKNARTFVWPTFYEGIGLPVLEAFSCNLPVVTSKRGALPEAAGKGAHYIENPYDIREVASAIYAASTDEKLRKELLDGAKPQLSKFTPEKFNKRFTDGLHTLQN